jgi:hypothetical protein
MLAAEAEKLELHVVTTPIKSYRLLAMSMDDDGFIWCGSIHRVVHRYDPLNGKVETIAMPYDSSASSCLCVGKKVYILGQSYPRLIVYDRTAHKFSELPYPSSKPDVWYGVGPIHGRILYLFDRGSAGVIRWDTETDSGTVIAYPYQGVLPSAGHYEAADNAIWCKLWDYSTGQYVPQGIARLDVARTSSLDSGNSRVREGAGIHGTADASGKYVLPALVAERETGAIRFQGEAVVQDDRCPAIW